MTPRLVLIVREDGSLQASCDCGGIDEIVPPERVAFFMLSDATTHVTDHSVNEPKPRSQGHGCHTVNELATCHVCCGSGVVEDFDGDVPCARCDGQGHINE